jgi:N-glycosylase/DNA lyase
MKSEARLLRLKLDTDCPLNLDFTLCCGQTFRWDKQGEWWYGVVKGRACKLRQVENTLEGVNVEFGFIKEYLGLDDDLPKIFAQINKDENMDSAIKAFSGLKILRQEPWECLISYICATYKNILAIKRMLHELSKKFGNKTVFEERNFYTFPTAKKLANASIDDLAKCGLGYRAKYVSETAKMIHRAGFDFECLKRLPYDEAKRELLHFPGVGLKVADCVLLFSLGKTEAFPVDVWVKRVIMRCYTEHFPKEFAEKISGKKSLTDVEYAKLSKFGRDYFGKYAGYAQEYLYHYERTKT